MAGFLDNCKRFLSRRQTGIIFLLVAILVKVITQFAFFRLVGDKAWQLLAAKNFLSGHGIAINSVSLDNISVDNFTPLLGWPPGYSIILTPLLWLFKNDYKTAALVFDIFCVFPFFYYLIRLLNFLSLQKWLRNLFILFVGFFNYPVGSGYSTDLISFCCVIAGFYYVLVFMRENAGSQGLVIPLTLSLFLAVFFRYSYIPVVLCFPALLIIAGILNGEKKWIRSGLLTGSILGFLLFLLMYFQHSYTGSSTFINSSAKGLFPGNLLYIVPIIPASLFDTGVGLTLFTRFTVSDYISNAKALSITGSVILFFLVSYGMNWGRKRIRQLKTNLDYFTYIGFFVSIIILCLLAFLSLRNSSYMSTFVPYWTYVQEFRYFIFLILFIQVIIFAYLFNRFRLLSGFWKKIAICCGLLMTLDFSHQIYFITKLLFFSKHPFNQTAIYQAETIPVFSIYKNAQLQYPGFEIIVASPQNDACNFAGLENLKAVYHAFPGSFTQPITSRVPAKIMIAIPSHMLTEYNAVLNRLSPHYFGKTNNLFFYLLDVPMQ
ncbi:MAG: hypothetical protein ABIR30_11745 [Chitinophagaceae bacterium]